MADTPTVSATKLSFDSVFGKAIPLLVGKCVVAGQVFWSSSDTLTKTTFASGASTSTGATFAVAFGKPDPSADSSYISRIWINGALSYDATSKSPVTVSNLTLTLYSGSEDQGVDPTIGKSVGKFCPAFRGLIYAVIAGVNFANLSGLPNVIAEITQTNNTKFDVFAPVGTAGALYFYSRVDADAGTVAYLYSSGIDVFDIETETFLYNIPIAADLQHIGVAELPNGNIIAAINGIGGQLLTIDFDTGAIIATSQKPGDGFTDAGDLVASIDGTYVLIAGGNPYSKFLAMRSAGGSLSLYKTLSDSNQIRGIKPSDVSGFPPFMKSCLYIQRVLVPLPITVSDQMGTRTRYEDNYKRPLLGQNFAALPPGGKAVTSSLGQYGFGTPVVPVASTTAPDPSFFYPPLDTSAFQLFYAVDRRKDVYRIVLTGGKTVPVAKLPSLFNAEACIRKTSSGKYFSDAEYIKSHEGANIVGTDYIDPELGAGAPLGYLYCYANEPEITRMSSDAYDKIYSVGANETIMEIIVGDADNSYVGLIVYNSQTKKTVYRKFDTFYSRQSTQSLDNGIFDCNYYLVEGDDSYKSPIRLVNPPMRDAVYNHFSAYADLVIPEFPEPYNEVFDNIKAHRWGDDLYTYVSGPSFVILNANAVTVQTKDISNFQLAGGASGSVNLPSDLTYDKASGLIFSAVSTVNFYLNSGLALGDTTLGNALRSLLLLCGYTAAQVDISNLSPIDVQGCVINQTVGLTAILDAVKQVFSLDIFDTNDKISFVRKTRGAKLSFDLIVSEDDLFPASESANESLLEYSRAYAGDLPTKQSLEYIDGPNFGTVGTQTAKRTTFPAKTTNSDQSIDTSVPIIMDAAAAIYWCNAMLFDKWASSLTTKFRLGPEAFAVEPGDYIGITRKSGIIEGVRVQSATLNKDRSISIEATSLIQFNDFAGVGSQAPTITAASLAKSAPPAPGLFDNVLFRIADDASSVTIPLRFISDQSIALQQYDGTRYSTLAGNRNVAAYGKLVRALPAAAAYGPICYNELDTKSVVLVRFKTRPALPQPVDTNALYSGKNFMLVGQPGRWEVVYFQSATANDTAGLVWSFTGLVRGRRGTEYLCTSSAASDLVIVPTSIDAMTLTALPIATAGAGVPVRLAPSGAVAAPTALTIQPGATHAPWAPCNLACVRSASATQPGLYDFAFTWQRRTRDEADELHDGNADVRNEFGAEAYAGNVSANLNSLADIASDAAAFVYTAEMQQAKGLTASPTSLTLSIAQIGNGLSGPTAYRSFNF